MLIGRVLVIVLCMAGALDGGAQAQDFYANKTITMIIGGGAGAGSISTAARWLAIMAITFPAGPISSSRTCGPRAASRSPITCMPGREGRIAIGCFPGVVVGPISTRIGP